MGIRSSARFLFGFGFFFRTFKSLVTNENMVSHAELGNMKTSSRVHFLILTKIYSLESTLFFMRPNINRLHDVLFMSSGTIRGL